MTNYFDPIGPPTKAKMQGGVPANQFLDDIAAFQLEDRAIKRWEYLRKKWEGVSFVDGRYLDKNGNDVSSEAVEYNVLAMAVPLLQDESRVSNEPIP